MVVILLFSLLGIAGSYGVAWFGIRINTFANSRTAFASLRGKPLPDLRHPAQGRHEHRHAAHQHRAGDDADASCCSCRATTPGSCFIGFAIGESLGASALRIAGGIFTKIADIGSDLMKIVFNIKEDDARNPGVIADCTGDNAGDSVGPSADGFETYGVTGVALITFILLAVSDPTVQVQLLVWIFAMRIMMIVASGLSYLVNEAVVKARYGNADQDELRGAADPAGLDHLDRVGGDDLPRVLPADPAPRPERLDRCGGSCRRSSAAARSRARSSPSWSRSSPRPSRRHVREVVTASREGGPSLNILSGLTAGNFSAYWMGITIVALMGDRLRRQHPGPATRS